MTEVTPLQQGRAEVLAQLHEQRTAELIGRDAKADITVPEFMDWGDGALAALQAGQLRQWAQEALSAEDFKKWVACRPTVRQVAEFFGRLKAETGEDLGESDAS